MAEQDHAAAARADASAGTTSTDKRHLLAERMARLSERYQAWRAENFPEPPPLTPYQRQVLLGSLFGDGCIVRRDDCRNPSYSETHGAAQEGYLRWKAEALASLRPHVGYGAMAKSGRQVHLRFPTAEMFWPLRRAFYPDGTKNLPVELLTELGPIGFAVWCMDDGCCSFDKHGSVHFTLSTDEFAGMEQQQRIQAHILNAFGIQARIQTMKGRGKHGLRLHFTVAESAKVLRLIEPHVVAPFREKWRLEDPETYRGPRSRAEVMRKANATRTARIKAGLLRVGYHTGTIRVPQQPPE